MLESSALLIPILTTGLAPLFIWLLRTNINAREGVSFAAGIITFGSVLTFVPPVLRGAPKSPPAGSSTVPGTGPPTAATG